VAKHVQINSELLEAARQVSNDITAESARTFEPRGVQFAFSERIAQVGKRTGTEYFIVARVMPERSSTMVNTSLMPPMVTSMDEYQL